MTVGFTPLVALMFAGAILGGGPAFGVTSTDPADALRDQPAPAIEIIPDTPRPGAARQRRSGNPLWSIPLRTLTATRERPIFSPGRRPPAPAVANAPFMAPVSAAPPSEPPHPLTLELIGTISSDTESFAILFDTGLNQVVRLRPGDAHDGWLLKSVQGREVTLQNDQRTETLHLPKPGDVPGRGRRPSPEL